MTVKTSIPKRLRIEVWDRDVGRSKRCGACYCCGGEIRIEAFECGHVVAESKHGATSLENLRAICGDCNRSMGAQNMHVWMRRWYPKRYNWMVYKNWFYVSIALVMVYLVLKI